MISYGKRILYSHKDLIAVGDVHGNHKNLLSILSKIEVILNAKTHIVFCGDIINRGANSIQCLLTLKEFSEKHPGQVFFIFGNHEQMLLDYLKIYLFKDNHYFTDHMETYGTETFNEMKEMFDISIDKETVKKTLSNSGILDFLMNFIPYYESEKVLITHAALDLQICLMYGLLKISEDPDKANAFSLEALGDAIRWQFTDESFEVPQIKKFRICGHQQAHSNKPRIFKNRAFIDTGCGTSNKPLTALLYPSKKFIQSDK